MPEIEMGNGWEVRHVNSFVMRVFLVDSTWHKLISAFYGRDKWELESKVKIFKKWRTVAPITWAWFFQVFMISKNLHYAKDHAWKRNAWFEVKANLRIAESYIWIMLIYAMSQNQSDYMMYHVNVHGIRVNSHETLSLFTHDFLSRKKHLSKSSVK